MLSVEAMSLSSALSQLDAIARLPDGWRDPKLADEPPHRSAPWIALPPALTDAVRGLLTELDREKLAMPSIVKPVAPYLGDGGVALWWRDEQVPIGSPPAVLVTITLVAGATCTIFEDELNEREFHAPGHDTKALDEAYDFIATAVRFWASLPRA